MSKELGIEFIESVYEKALMVALQQKGLKAERQKPLTVHFRGVVVGEFFVDILIENKVLLELKAVNVLVNEYFAQTINYLKATGIEVGMLINFGKPKLEYRRFNNKFLEEQSLKDFFKR